MNINETKSWEIMEELGNGKIDVTKALIMAKYSLKQLLELYQGEKNLVLKIRECTDPDSFHWKNLYEYQRLGQLIKELESDNKPKSFPLESEPFARVPHASGALGRICWSGNASSWERVYEALTDSGFIPADPSLWASHFVDKKGEPMSAPVGGNAVLGNARKPGTRAAVNRIRSLPRSSAGE